MTNAHSFPWIGREHEYWLDRLQGDRASCAGQARQITRQHPCPGRGGLDGGVRLCRVDIRSGYMIKYQYNTIPTCPG